MFIHIIGACILLATAFPLQAQIKGAPSDGGAVVIERGPHHRVWQSVVTDIGLDGESYWRTNSYVELQIGVSVLEGGVWTDANDVIELHPEGAVAQHTQHKVIFAPNLNTKNAIDLLTPDGKRMQSSPIGLAYFDPVSGKSAWIGGVQNSQGAILGSNQVIYTNAFSNILATVRYTVTKAGIEQDIVIQEIPPDPTVFGLSGDKIRLEVISEFFTAEVPAKRPVVLKHYDPILGQTMAEPDFVDEQLDFGAMITGPGRAFKLSDQDDLRQGVPVGKRFGTSDGRTFMIEGVEYQALRKQFSQLPKSKSSIRTAMMPAATQGRVFPPVQQIAKAKSSLWIAKSGLPLDAGVVIDYSLVGNTNSMVFRGESTYLVVGTVYLTGTSIIEGGCTLKYTNYTGCLDFCGPLKTETGPYHPAIITSMDDNSVGDPISGSTGIPTGYHGAGFYVNYDSDIQYLYFKHLQFGFICVANTTQTISHCKFYNMQTGFDLRGVRGNMRNLLFDNVMLPFYFTGGSNSCVAENITTVYASYGFADKLDGVVVNLGVTNSIFAQCTFLANLPFNSDYCGIENTTNGIFQTVLDGGSYLAANTYQNLGTTNITPSLLKDLRVRTTYPPVLLTNTALTPISTNMVLTPIAARDSGIPALGYHYDPLDYMVNNLYVTNATLTLTNGASVGFYGSFGFILKTGAAFISEGTQDKMNHIVHYQAVQDRSTMFDPTSGQQAVWYPSSCPLDLSLKFTDLPIHNRNGRQYTFGAYIFNRMVIENCQLWNGTWAYIPTTTAGTVAWTNNLAKRVTLRVTEGYMGNPAPLNFYCYNNTFVQSVLNFKNDVTNYTWGIYDNSFDNCALTNTGTAAGSDYNAYVNTSTVLGGSHNVTLSSFSYTNGAFGSYYQGITNLVNKGSRNATNAGFFSFTTQPSDMPETNSVVDIGFHYKSADSDGDGMPDVWETAYGFDPFAADANLDSDDDGITNLQEYLGGSNPLDTMLIAWGKNQDGQCVVPYAFPGVYSMAAGGTSPAGGFTLVVTNQGRIFAWGETNSSQANRPSGLSNVVSVAACGDQCAALKSDGTVIQWGQTKGTIPSGLNNVKAISAGYHHFLALKNDGNVVAWGLNVSNCPANSVPPTLSGVKAIGAGWNHNVALLNDGTVTSWGLNATNLKWNLLNAPTNLSGVSAISVGALHSVALLSNSTVVAWGNNQSGETNVPTGLSNVVAVAAGRGYTLALLQDQSIRGWGGGLPAIPSWLRASAIVAGPDHALAARTGILLPQIVIQPQGQGAISGGTNIFNVLVSSRQQPAYQWQFNRVNIAGATNDTLVIENVNAQKEGQYRVFVTNGAGTIYSDDAELVMLNAPVLISPTDPQTVETESDGKITLTVNASAHGSQYFPTVYWWYKDGQILQSLSQSNLTLGDFGSIQAGHYWVVVSNEVGFATSAEWNLNSAVPGGVFVWGTNMLFSPEQRTNTIAIAGGGNHALALREDSTVLAWGDNGSGQTNIPSGLTNVICVAAGTAHSLVLKEDGTVIHLDTNTLARANFPTGLNDATAISAGGYQSLALKSNGTVVQWGQTFSNVPTAAVNVIAIASGTNFHLALLTNKTVVAWGTNNSGQLSMPANLTNVVAIAAGGTHALALKGDGTVTNWGSNLYGEGNIPSGLSNVLAIAAGTTHSVALKNDGTIVAWGDNSYGQTNASFESGPGRLIAAGNGFTLASRFSPTIQYAINVTNDVLLVYNTNSVGSSNVCNYYLAHRPKIGGANVLGIGCITYETALPDEFTNQISAPIFQWLSTNPTKHPSYIILFYDIPSRVHSDRNYSGFGDHSSVGYSIYELYNGWKPFITHINMNNTNDCVGYINKISNFGAQYSPNKLVINPSANGYANTNYYFDDLYTSGTTTIGYNGLQGVTSNGVPLSSVIYNSTNSTTHITRGTNVSGFYTTGSDGGLGTNYFAYFIFAGNSQWYIMETMDSFNGMREYFASQPQCHFVQWFSPNAFGGANYTTTPVGAVSHVDEPLISGVEDAEIYFGLWAAGKNFAICAWNARTSVYFQATGDPFVKR